MERKLIIFQYISLTDPVIGHGHGQRTQSELGFVKLKFTHYVNIPGAISLLSPARPSSQL